MSNQFSEFFKRTAAESQLVTFGEPVVYFPLGGDVSEGITMQALVNRNENSIVQELGTIVGESAIVSVLNVATTATPNGILSHQIDTGLDQIELPMQIGEVPRRKQIVRLLSSNAGKTRFLVQ